MTAPDTITPTAGPAAAPAAPAFEPAEIIDIASPPWQGLPWPLLPGEPLAQTFVARADDLCAVEVLLAVAPGAVGTLRLGLRADGSAGAPLHEATLPMVSLVDGRYARLALPPLGWSAGRRFCLSLAADAPGLAVYSAGLARLGDGQVYRGLAPADGCLVFRTFSAAPDARLAARREAAAALAERAALSLELSEARRTIAALEAERAALTERLHALFRTLTTG